jgi:sugar phosphate permease
MYFGWIVVIVGALIMMLTMGTTVSVFGLYVLPVSEEFGLTRAEVNSGFALMNLGGAVIAPLVGRAADTWPVRRVMTAGALCYALACITIGLSDKLWLNAIVLGMILPVTIGGLTSFGVMALVTRWFEAQRARALSLAAIGMSLGSVVMAPFVGWMLGSVGWRHMLVGQGIVIGALFLLMILILRDRPGPNDVEPRPKGLEGTPPPAAVAAADQKPLSTREILSKPAFYVIAVTMALGMGTVQAVTISLIPMVQQTGIGLAAAAAGLISIMGVAGIAGRLALAAIGDRVNKALVLSLCLAAFAALVVMLPVPKTYLAVAVIIAVIGFLGGAILPLCFAILAEVVGPYTFASANGLASLVMALIGAATIRLSGDIYDATGTYHAVFAMLGGAIALGSLLMLVYARLSRAATVEVPA